jgi:signal transduction histidine kinase
MTLLLDDLLDVARITTGRVELKTSDVELSPLVAHAVDAARPLITSRGHHLRVRETAQNAWLHADPLRVTQVLSNLLTNAAKYTDPGGNIELVTAERDGWVEIRVKDDGIGFSSSMRERLFTLFSQETDALSRAAGGLGIGLALVREFVERHGGSVNAASAGAGKGSEFTIRLPLIQAPARI